MVDPSCVPSPRTVRRWWDALKTSAFIAEIVDRGRRGFEVRIADRWLAWRILEARSPRPAQRPNMDAQEMSAPSTPPQRSNMDVEQITATSSAPLQGPDMDVEQQEVADQRSISAVSTPDERPNMDVEVPAYKELHDDQKPPPTPVLDQEAHRRRVKALVVVVGKFGVAAIRQLNEWAEGYADQHPEADEQVLVETVQRYCQRLARTGAKGGAILNALRIDPPSPRTRPAPDRNPQEGHGTAAGAARPNEPPAASPPRRDRAEMARRAREIADQLGMRIPQPAEPRETARWSS